MSHTESRGPAHLSPAELAEREGVPLETVYKWNRERTGPRYMKIGIHVRYRIADVLSWEESRFVDGHPGRGRQIPA